METNIKSKKYLILHKKIVVTVECWTIELKSPLNSNKQEIISSIHSHTTLIKNITPGRLIKRQLKQLKVKTSLKKKKNLYQSNFTPWKSSF